MKSASCNEAIKIVGLRINWCRELATYFTGSRNPTVYFNSHTHHTEYRIAHDYSLVVIIIKSSVEC